MEVSFTEPARTTFWDPRFNFFQWEDLISNGTSSHILGPRNDKDVVP